MLSILYVYRSTYVHITAAIIGEMIKSSTFHDINKCITASEQMIINVGSDNNMSGRDKLFCIKKLLAALSHN